MVDTTPHVSGGTEHAPAADDGAHRAPRARPRARDHGRAHGRPRGLRRDRCRPAVGGHTALDRRRELPGRTRRGVAAGPAGRRHDQRDRRRHGPAGAPHGDDVGHPRLHAVSGVGHLVRPLDGARHHRTQRRDQVLTGPPGGEPGRGPAGRPPRRRGAHRPGRRCHGGLRVRCSSPRAQRGKPPTRRPASTRAPPGAAPAVRRRAPGRPRSPRSAAPPRAGRAVRAACPRWSAAGGWRAT